MSVDWAFNQVVASREKQKVGAEVVTKTPSTPPLLWIYINIRELLRRAIRCFLNAQRQTCNIIFQNVSLDHYCSLRSGCGHIQRPFSSPSPPKHLPWFKPRVHPKRGKKTNKNVLPKIAWCPSPEDKRGSTTYVLWTKANELLVFCRPRGATKLLYPTSTTVCNFHSGYICQQCKIRYGTSIYWHIKYNVSYWN